MMRKLKIKNKKLKITLSFCVLIFGFCILLSGCGRKVLEKTTKIPVKVMRVELKNIKETLDYVGNIKAKDEALIYPKVSGKIIEKLKDEGSPVNKGDIILYIDRDEVGFQFEKAPVETPLTGIVGRVYVDIGTNVTSQTPVALVIDMDKVKIELDIPEKYIPKVSLGQVAEINVDAYPQESFIGKVFKVSPVLDIETRSAPIEIIIPNKDHRLKSGMFARAGLIIDVHKKVPIIIKEAIMGKKPQQYVYVISQDKAVQRNIRLGIKQGAYYEVIEGLKEGDSVVVMGQQKLYDGVAVTVEEEKSS